MLTAIVLIDTDPARIPEVASEVADLRGVSEVYSVTGKADLVAMVRVQEHDQLADVIADRISKVQGVVRTETFIAFRAYSNVDLEQAFALGLADCPAVSRAPAARGAVARRGRRAAGARRARGGRVDAARRDVVGRAQPLDERTLRGTGQRAVGDEASGRVEQHGLAHRARLAREEPPRDVGVVRRVPAPQVLDGDGRQREVGDGVEAVLRHGAVAHLPHRGAAGRRELVEAVVAAEHERRRAAPGEHAGDERRHPGVGHPDRGRARLRGVRQGAEHVERRRDAELLARDARVPHRRVEHHGEAEGDPRLLHDARHAVGTVVEPDPELLEHVCGPGRRRRGAVAVLDDAHARARDDERRHRRDVHGVGAVAARADDVHGGPVHGEAARVREHRVGETGELGDRLALRAQRDEEAREPHGRDLARHDLVHGPRGALGVEVVPRDELGEQTGPGEPRTRRVARGRGGRVRGGGHGWPFGWSVSWSATACRRRAAGRRRRAGGRPRRTAGAPRRRRATTMLANRPAACR